MTIEDLIVLAILQMPQCFLRKMRNLEAFEFADIIVAGITKTINLSLVDHKLSETDVINGMLGMYEEHGGSLDATIRSIQHNKSQHIRSLSKKLGQNPSEIADLLP